jgi:PadR family transcriptional regulator
MACRLLRALLADPQEMYGQQICAEAGLPSGTVHPILAWLENGYGRVTSRWEDIKPEDEGRPRRRYYQLDRGRRRTRLAQAATSISTIGLRTRPAGGLGLVRPHH